ncbi:MAG: hypothetical protein J2P15_22160 [Micromonosporaceae bacterium]|nr:hypothetical protein [Micromonosporaceae bacterium]
MAAYAESGIAHYWIVDQDGRVTMLALGVDVDGRPAYHRSNERRPTAEELVARVTLPEGVLL